MIQSLLLFAEGQGAEPANPLAMFVPLILIFVVFYFLIIMPARRQERRQREELFSKLKKNDEVVTSAGIIGIVANIKEPGDEVTLKVDESSNVRLRVLKSSIVRILNSEKSAKEASAKPETSEAITK
jgi:preprotein translocase subunit YajC